MNKQQKEMVVQELRNNFTHHKASFIVSYKGLTVEQLKSLRNDLYTTGGVFKVAKARLMKRAVEGTESAKDLDPFLKEQIGIVFASGQPPAVAKTLHEFSKKNESLKLIVGCLDDKVFDAAAVVRIASLPSKEVLLAQVCGTMKMPMVQFVGVLNVMLIRLLWTLKQVAEKKQ